ncbi:MAG: TMEM165/GDT1 family protein, partial [Pseudomonadota bacterium]|nr:TMEM165/GDT1 family protein [Pseudomonadota bacterium]
MHAFLVSLGIVFLAEIGDKTQILSLALASRYRQPIPITLGVFSATLISHTLAGGIGRILSHVLNPLWLNWAIVASFILMGAWMLVPDSPESDETAEEPKRWGIFNTTLVLFLAAEMGDRTQIATLALA